MPQFEDQDYVQHQQVTTIEPQAPLRLLTAEEISAVAGGPPFVNM